MVPTNDADNQEMRDVAPVGDRLTWFNESEGMETVAPMDGSNEAVRKARKTPYRERPDLVKLQSQWNKLYGLHDRNESSAAIVRCATAAEIAANYAIRLEFQKKTKFDADLVDKFLIWANGLRGKMERLFVPIHFAKPRESETAKALIASAEKINKVRNEVVHQGCFSNPDEAEAAIAEAKLFIDLLVGLFKPGFDIQPETYRPTHHPGDRNLAL